MYFIALYRDKTYPGGESESGSTADRKQNLFDPLSGLSNKFFTLLKSPALLRSFPECAEIYLTVH